MAKIYEPIVGLDEFQASRQNLTLQTLLSSQSSIWTIVLDLEDSVSCKTYSIFDVASRLAFFNDKCRIWWICHDKEKEDSVHLKKPHVHIVLDFGNRHRMKRVLSFLMEAFEYAPNDYICRCYDYDNGTDDVYCLNPWINIRPVVSLDKMLRYLIHLDEKDKEHYNPVDVITNDKDTFELAISGDTASMAQGSYWVNLVKMYNCDFQEIAMHLPTKILKDNFFLIRELCKTCRR